MLQTHFSSVARPGCPVFWSFPFTPDIVFQAPQYFRPPETHATCDDSPHPFTPDVVFQAPQQFRPPETHATCNDPPPPSTKKCVSQV